MGKATRDDEDKGQHKEGTLPALGQKGKRRETYARRCEREVSRSALRLAEEVLRWVGRWEIRILTLLPIPLPPSNKLPEPPIGKT